MGTPIVCRRKQEPQTPARPEPDRIGDYKLCRIRPREKSWASRSRSGPLIYDPALNETLSHRGQKKDGVTRALGALGRTCAAFAL